MHPRFLLASLLANLPFISATPARRVDDARIVQYVTVSEVPMWGVKGCYKDQGGLRNEATPSQGTANITVETCLDSCRAGNASQGGVTGSKCYCDTGRNSGTQVDDSECKKSTCAGNEKEYCGSSTRLILYEKTFS